MAAKIARMTAASLAVAATLAFGTDFTMARGGGHGGGGHGGGGRGGGGAHFGAAHVGGGHGRGIGRAHFAPSRGAVARVGGHGRAFRSASVGAPRGVTRAYSRSYRGFSRSASARTLAPIRGAYGRAGIAASGAWARGSSWGYPYARTGWRGGWGGWAGPIFWPYVYGNVLAYALWPARYYDPYWYDPFWGYGDIFVWNSMFWPGPMYAGPPVYDVYGADRYRDRRVRVARPIDADQFSACSGLAPGVTDLPIDSIAATVYPTDEQMRALEALRAASLQASDVLKASCSNDVSLTPVGRLDAMQKRLDGMVQALAIVRTPLDNFYNSLTEDQRRRFETIGPAPTSRRGRRVAAPDSANDLVALCARRAEGFTQLPVQRVEQIVQPTLQQQDAFSRLKVASSDAANILQASCPSQTPQTPLDRFDAVDKRLNAMASAVKIVRPALETFYLSLSDEQKARFNTLGPPSPQG